MKITPPNVSSTTAAQAAALLPQMQQSLADTAQSEAQRNANVIQAVSNAGAAGAQALGMTGRVQYLLDSDRIAASPANGTNAYVIATRMLWTRTAGAWVSQGSGLLSPDDIAFPYIPAFNARTTVGVTGVGGVQSRLAYTAEAFGLKADTTTDNTTRLIDAMTSGEHVVFTGLGGADYSVSGTATVTGALGRIYEFQGQAALKQQSSRTPVLKFSAGNDLEIRNPRLAGLGNGEWNGLSTNQGRLLWIDGGQNIRVIGGLITGFGFAGLYADKVTDMLTDGLKVVGPGDITANGNQNFGIKYASNWDEEGKPGGKIMRCDVSSVAQGIFTGPGWDELLITLNIVHDIPGQHGMYLNPGNDMTVTNNRTFRTALNGIKVQASFANRGNSKKNLAFTGNRAAQAGNWAFVISSVYGGVDELGAVVPLSLYLNPTITNNINRDCLGGMVVESSREMKFDFNSTSDSTGMAFSFRNTTGRGRGNRALNSKTSTIQMLTPVPGGRIELLDWNVKGSNLDLTGLPGGSDQLNMVYIDNTAQTVRLSGTFDIGAGNAQYSLFEAIAGTVELTDLTLPRFNADGTVLNARITGELAEMDRVTPMTFVNAPTIPALGRKGRGYSALQTVGAALPPSGLPYQIGQVIQASNPVAGTFKETVVTGPGYQSQSVWAAATAYAVGQTVTAGLVRVYKCTVAGTSSATAPTHTTGTATDGTVTWQYVGAAVTAYGVGAINGVVDPMSKSGGTVAGAFTYTNTSPLQLPNGWVLSAFVDNPALGQNVFYLRNSTTRDNLDWIKLGPSSATYRLKGVAFRAYATYLDAPDGTWTMNAGRSGTTANRPTTTTVPTLYVGMPYYDTTLNKPIWIKTASATPVWIDATGATV